jgi:hypothetical protein
MKDASFTVMDMQGRHNADGDATYARLMKGASWKKQRIVMVIPSASMIAAKVYLNHMNLIFPPNQGVVKILAEGMEVGHAYSAAIDNILAHPDLREWEYLLTVESDNMPPSDGVLKLIEDMEAHPEFACIGGLYFTKGEGGVPQIWGDKRDPVMNFRPQLPDPAGRIVECWGTGMGFNLWRLSMFRDWKGVKPYFRTIAGTQGVGTQDLSMAAEAQKQGFRFAVDCSIKVGHWDQQNQICW